MGNEIVQQPDNELINQAVNTLGEPLSDAKVLTVARDTPHFDFGRALAFAAQLLNVGDTIRNIEKNMQYVVQVPLKYQEALADGTLEMLHGQESGKTWATVVRKLENGQNEIVCNCPIEEKQMIKGNPLQSMTDAYQNMYMQQKLSELSEQVKQVYNVCLRIEQGQTDDRIGKFESGREDVVRAMMRSPGVQRDQELALARSKISEAQHQIGENFKSRLNAYAGIPESRIERIINEIISPKTEYMAQKDDEFNKLQDYFDFYLKATKFLAASYAAVGDHEQAEHVYISAMEFIQRLDFSKLQTLRFIHPEEKIRDTFCYRATEYVETEKVICLEEARQYDFITLPVSGDELLEVLNNG